MLSKRQVRYLDEVRRIVLDDLADHPAGVWLFGSFARGTPDRASDIDVAIEPRASLPPGLMARMEADLEASTVPYFVQLVNLADTGATFREAVHREGIPWRT
jgi:predicted nucleotidyltransferase